MGEDSAMDNRQVKRQVCSDTRPLPSVEELQTLFNEYNKLYFWGKLGKCEFHYIPKSQNSAGWYNHRKLKSGKVRDQIWIGKCVRWTDQVLKEILVHEMIHMYNRTVESDKCDGLLGHGRRFRRQCRRLLKEHGVKIHIHGGYEYIDNRPAPALWEKLVLWIMDR
jgi:hypothetical protein